MPEVRIDPLSGLRTIVAGERGERPGAAPTFERRAAIDPAQDPFAEGQEGRTPPEVYAVRPEGGVADGPGWTVRVVPNRYPALEGPGAGGGGQEGLRAGPVDGFRAPGVEPPGSPKSTPPARSASVVDDPVSEGSGGAGLFEVGVAGGAHEVVVNTPRSVGSLLDLSVGELEGAMGVWRERMRFHGEMACRHLIVNEGREAGASLPHTHAQLYALSFVPAAVARERERFRAYWEQTQGRNLLEDLVAEEIRAGERLVAVDREAVAICPFGARAPYQLQVVPRRPAALFEDDGPLGAAVLAEALGRLAGALGELPPLNLWVRTAPRGAEVFCWRIDVVPRLGQPAGLELGTGVWLNAVAPETAAARLRDAEPAAGGGAAGAAAGDP